MARSANKWLATHLLLVFAQLVMTAALLAQHQSSPEEVSSGASPTALPFCARSTEPWPSSRAGRTKRSAEQPPPDTVNSRWAILVSTLDGRVTALDSTNGSLLWSHATGNGDLLSSTISNHEFSSQGKWVRLVPSLDGDLYTFDGENMGAALASVDALLSNSLKMSDDTVVTGGKEVLTYAVDLRTGLLRYSCGAQRCHYYNGSSPTTKTTTQTSSTENENAENGGGGGGAGQDDEPETDDDVRLLLLNLLTKTVRAVAAHNGSEKWNYSVGQHEAKMAPSRSPRAGCHGGADSAESNRPTTAPLVRFVPSEGVVLAFDGADSFNPLWDYKFETPIVHAWSVIGRDVLPLDLFENSYDSRQDTSTPTDSQHHRGHRRNDQYDHALPRPILYIGTYNKQLYIMESGNVQKNIPLEYKSFGIDLTTAPPQVIWQPYLFSAQSRTPLIVGRRPPSDLALISHVGSEESTALVVSHNGVEYPFDNGFYLYPSRPLNVNSILIELDGEEGQVQGEEEAESFQIIIISLWYWWKEVLAISVTFAVLVNLCITRHFIVRMQKKFTKESRQNVVTVASAPLTTGAQSEAEAAGASTEKRQSQPDLRSQSSSESATSLTTPPSEFVSRYQTDFEPVEILGKGGFGVVFHARNKIDDCQYAIKRICMPNRSECKERIMREVKALAKLDHAGIVRYYNSWLECPPPHWQEKMDRQWSSSGEGFLTPSASMTMDELHRAYGLRGSLDTKVGRNALRGASRYSSSSAADLSSAPAQVRERRRRVAAANNNTNTSAYHLSSTSWSDLTEGDNDSQSESDSDSDSLPATTRHSVVDHDDDSSSFIVFASQSQEADCRSTSARPRRPPTLPSLLDAGLGGGAGAGDNDDQLSDVVQSESSRPPHKSSSDAAGGESAALISPFVWPKPDRLYLYIQMQLCRQDSLKDWLSANTRGRDRLLMLDFFDQIMSAVEYVHVQGLMHRDLKPSNIFFALDGAIKVGDFGLVAATIPNAGEASAPTSATTTTTTSNCGSEAAATATATRAAVDVRHTNQVGTMLYMSPEQIAGQNYDHKVDIYSMGLIFFEMLVPFTTGMERVKTMSEVRRLKFPPNFVSEYPVEHSLVASMLTHAPADRPSSSEVKGHSLFQDFQPRPELLRWSRRARTTSRTFSTSSSGSGGPNQDPLQLNDSGDSVEEQQQQQPPRQQPEMLLDVATATVVAAAVLSNEVAQHHQLHLVDDERETALCQMAT